MKKTDTCYYMSITKEENSAFVVANNQTTGTEFSGVAVEKREKSSTSATFLSPAVPPTLTTTSAATTTTTISTTNPAGGNGTAMSKGAEMHLRCKNNVNETSSRQETCIYTSAPRATLPPVILQVPLSTSTLQHHNLLASDVHRECRMRLAFFFLFFLFFFKLVFFQIRVNWISKYFEK